MTSASPLPDLVLVPPARSQHPDVVEAFQIRSWSRAYLAAAGLMDFHEATDSLQELAEGNSLVERFGQDGVQTLMANQFEAVRSIFGEQVLGECADDLPPTVEIEGSAMAEPGTSSTAGWRPSASTTTSIRKGTPAACG